MTFRVSSIKEIVHYLIIGGTSNIGLAVSNHLANQNHYVIAVAIHNINDLNGNINHISQDVLNDNSVPL